MIPLFVTMNLLPAGMSRDTPPDWEQSGRAIDAFVNRMCRAGFVPTLFASPEATRAHAPLLEECINRGCEIGLLVAPSQSTLLKQKQPFGLLPPETQQQVLQHARQLFFDYMGFVPRSVRTGLSSGTPDVFARCKAAGFSHSSIRMPGAQLSTISNVWPAEHQITDASTVDIPISTNPAERLLNRFPLYLSPEFGTPTQQTELVTRVRMYGHLCSMSSTVIDYYPQDTPIHDNIDAFIAATDTIPNLVPMRISQYDPTAPHQEDGTHPNE